VLTSSPDRVMPSAPHTIADTGLNTEFVLEHVAKTLLAGGELSGTELAERLGVRFSLFEPVIEALKRERHCEVTGGGLIGAASYRYRLTDAGRVRAALFAAQNQYIGALPVSIQDYHCYMTAFAFNDQAVVTRDAVRRAFSHLVLSDRVLDQLGPAVTARHSLFIYGAPGNGKTVIARAIRNLLQGDVAIPHAVVVGGHVVRVFDPVNHDAIPEPAVTTLDGDVRDDGRWVRCRRPMIVAGGELTLKSLDLAPAGKGISRVPVQGLANGGVLVIDDFGRQHVAPIDLLNRWIVPLESRVDFLTLDNGQKFEIPFHVFVVFATNLNPSDLVDEAFLRRIQYKMYADSPTADDFTAIFRNCCHERGIAFDPAAVETLLATELYPRGVALRACQPRDLIDHALSLAAYLGRPRAATPDLLESACATYFVENTASASPSPR
jgi:predicted ATPase with chaperone activity